MKDRCRINLSQGAQVFEWNGLACYRYNASLKVSGDSVKVCFYENGIMMGYPKNKRPIEKEKPEYDPEERWIKTGKMAKKRLYDFVACNLHKHLDHNGKKQSFKFLTLTFREDVKKLDHANKHFKNFIGRLNYHFHGGESEDFLKYVAVPELQMENNRYVWHYHVLFFNLPFIAVSGEMVDKLINDGRLQQDYDKRDTLYYIWGQGSVDVCRIKFNDAYDVAGYVAKYIGKGLEDVFEYAQEEKLLHKKRFLRSSGLIGPRMMIAFLNKKQRQAISDYFKSHCKKFKRKGELGKYFETFNVDNEFIGRLFGINFRSAKKHIENLEDLFDSFSYGFN